MTELPLDFRKLLFSLWIKRVFYEDRKSLDITHNLKNIDPKLMC